MKLRITGRHMDVTPALRRYLETRFDRLDRYELKVGIVQVVLSVEKLQHKAEAVCVVHGKRVQAKTSTREMYATIDALVDRIDGQLRKLKERVVSHKPAKGARAKSVRSLGAELVEPAAFKVERRAVPVLSFSEAHDRFDTHSEEFFLFSHTETGNLHVLQRAVGGRVLVIEPFAEGRRGHSFTGARE